jgi:hypothetical protein
LPEDVAPWLDGKPALRLNSLSLLTAIQDNEAITGREIFEKVFDMNKLLRLATAFLLTAAAAANAQMSMATHLTASGHAISVNSMSMTDHIVLYDGHVLLSDKVDQFVSLDGPYTGQGRTFILIDEEPGGNACEGNFQAIEVAGAVPAPSKQFGNCDDQAKVWVARGVLHIVTPKYQVAGMSGNIVPEAAYTYSKGVLTETKVGSGN